MKTLEGDYHAAICKAGGISGDNADDFNKVSARRHEHDSLVA